jgi:hypothetical protein
VNDSDKLAGELKVLSKKEKFRKLLAEFSNLNCLSLMMTHAPQVATETSKCRVWVSNWAGWAELLNSAKRLRNSFIAWQGRLLFHTGQDD